MIDSRFIITQVSLVMMLEHAQTSLHPLPDKKWREERGEVESVSVYTHVYLWEDAWECPLPQSPLATTSDEG